MATTEERLQILKMIEEGKISAAEGAELLRALDTKGERGQPLGRAEGRRAEEQRQGQELALHRGSSLRAREP